jgi:integral membrane protein
LHGLGDSVLRLESMKLSPKSLFAFFAVAETVTWTLLIGAILARATIGVPSEVFFVVGASHGFTFLGFVAVSKLVGFNQRWSLGKITLIALLAIVPFATIPFERKLAKSGELEGNWRTQKSDDLRDEAFVDRLFRWFIARPIILVLAIAALVVGLFSFLLWLGPPYEWGK